MRIAEAKVRRGDIEYTIPVDMSRCVGQQIRETMDSLAYKEQEIAITCKAPSKIADTMKQISNEYDRIQRLKETKEVVISGDDIEALKHWQREVHENVRVTTTDDWIARQSCGVWVCNVGEEVNCG